MGDPKRGKSGLPDLSDDEPTVVDEKIAGVRRTADWTDTGAVQKTADWTDLGAGPPPSGDGVNKTADWSNIDGEQTPGGDGIGKTADWTHFDTEKKPVDPNLSATRAFPGGSNFAEEPASPPGKPMWEDLLD